MSRTGDLGPLRQRPAGIRRGRSDRDFAPWDRVLVIRLDPRLLRNRGRRQTGHRSGLPTGARAISQRRSEGGTDWRAGRTVEHHDRPGVDRLFLDLAGPSRSPQKFVEADDQQQERGPDRRAGENPGGGRRAGSRRDDLDLALGNFDLGLDGQSDRPLDDRGRSWWEYSGRRLRVTRPPIRPGQPASHPGPTPRPIRLWVRP